MVDDQTPNKGLTPSQRLDLTRLRMEAPEAIIARAMPWLRVPWVREAVAGGLDAAAVDVHGLYLLPADDPRKPGRVALVFTVTRRLPERRALCAAMPEGPVGRDGWRVECWPDRGAEAINPARHRPLDGSGRPVAGHGSAAQAASS